MAARVPSAGVLILLLAWLVVLLSFAGAVGYAFLAPVPTDLIVILDRSSSMVSRSVIFRGHWSREKNTGQED